MFPELQYGLEEENIMKDDWAWYFEKYADKYKTSAWLLDEWYDQSETNNNIDMPTEYDSKDPKNVKKRVKRFYKKRLEEMSEVVTMRDGYYVRYAIQGPRPKSRLNPFFAVIYVIGKMFGNDTGKFEIHGIQVREEMDEYIVEVTLAYPGQLIGRMGEVVNNLEHELTKAFDKKCKVSIVEAKENFLSKQTDNDCY